MRFVRAYTLCPFATRFSATDCVLTLHTRISSMLFDLFAFYVACKGAMTSLVHALVERSSGSGEIVREVHELFFYHLDYWILLIRWNSFFFPSRIIILREKKVNEVFFFLIWIGNEITRFIHVIVPFRDIGNDRKEILDSKANLRLFLWKVRTGFYHGLVISPTADRQLRFINAVGSDSTSEKKINFSCDKRGIRRLKENRCLVDGTRDALDC